MYLSYLAQKNLFLNNSKAFDDGVFSITLYLPNIIGWMLKLLYFEFIQIRNVHHDVL